MVHLLLLLPLGPARAHTPHTVVISASAPALDDGRAWMILDPGNVSQILRSDDHGQHWDFVGGSPQEELLERIVAHGDHLWIVGSGGQLWGSADEGATWEEASLGAALAQDLAASEDGIAVATDLGLWMAEGDDLAGGGWVLTGHDLVAVANSPDAPLSWVVATADGTVARTDDGGGSWTTLPEATDEILSVAFAAERVVVGTTAGAAWHSPGRLSWTACAVLPGSGSEAVGAAVPELAATAEGSLLAANGLRALMRSEDGCDHWEHLDVGVEVQYGSIGYAQEPEEAWTGLAQAGEWLLAAGFMGAYSSADDGESWTEAPILQDWYTRGLAISPAWPDDPRIFVAGYGGGVKWTVDGGRTWAGSALGLDNTHTYGLALATDFERSGLAWYAANLEPYRSLDGGLTWESLADRMPMQRTRAFRAFEHRTWALGEDSSPAIRGRLAVSDDGGETFTLLEAFTDHVVNAAPNDIAIVTLADGRTQLLVSVDMPAGLVGSTDGGETWRTLAAGEHELAAGVAAWPPGAVSRLLFAAPSTGLVLSDDLGASWRAPEAGVEGAVQRLLATDDGTLFAASRGGLLWRREDGGERWEMVGEPLAPAVLLMEASPGFAEHDLLLAGTLAGVYWSQDRGESWHLLSDYQRLEDGTHLLHCHQAESHLLPPSGSGADCATEADEAAHRGGRWLLDEGDHATFTMRGHRFSVVSPSTAGQGLEVQVDGVVVAELVADGSPLVVEGLGPGWSDVALVARDVGAEPLAIDLVEVWGEGAALDLPGGEDTGGEDTGGEDTGGGDSGMADGGGTDGGVADGGGTDGGMADGGTDGGGTDGGGTDGGSAAGKDGCGCSGAPGPAGWLGLLAGGALVARRRPGRRTNYGAQRSPSGSTQADTPGSSATG